MFVPAQVLDFPDQPCVLTPFPESDDGMTQPSNKERFDGIDARLGGIGSHISGIDSRLDRIESALELRPPKPKSPFAQLRGQVWQWIVANKALVISVVAILVGIGGWFGSGYFKYWLDHKDDAFNDAADRRIEKALKAPGGVLATLEEVRKTTNATNTTLGTLQPFIHDVIDRQFENVSKLPTHVLIDRAPAVANLLSAAKDQKIVLDRQIVAETGKKFVQASPQSPAAWDAALGFLNYKSYVNSVSPLLPNLRDARIVGTHYRLPPLKEGQRYPTFTHLGIVPKESAAQFNLIGQDYNANLSTGDAYLIATGGDLPIDGMELRNVAFINVHITYDGGPVRIKNVYFINCTFEMKTAPSTQNLALAVLEPSPATNFSGM